MPASSSSTVRKSASPMPVDSVSLAKEAAKHLASRRGSAASWLHPLSSSEVPESDPPHNPLFPRHGLQLASGDDIMNGGGGAGSSSLLSATETSPVQIREGSGWKSLGNSARITSGSKQDSRSCRGYARLTGLLTRRGGDAKSRKAVAVSNTASLQSKCPEGAPHGTTIPVSSGAAVRNPLQRTENNSCEECLLEELCLDDVRYDWPSPPSPSTISVSNKLGSSRSGAVGVALRSSVVNSTLQSGSRRDLSVSPLVSQSSRASPQSMLRHDGNSGTNGTGIDLSEARFVPLGSTDLANRNGSPHGLQRSYGSGADDDKATTSGTLRNRSQRQKLISGSSLSTSASQSLAHMGSTRASQALATRNTGDCEFSAHASLSARSVRDAKVALLRRTQHGNGHSLRSSHTHSLRHSHSNASIGGSDPISQRVTKVRPSSRDRRHAKGTAGPLIGGDPAGSPHSIAAADDGPARTSVPPVRVGSSLTHSHMAFPPAAVGPEGGGGKSEHNISSCVAHRRFSRPEDNPLLEVMETSSCASQGWYEICNGALCLPSVADQQARSRMAIAGSSSSKSIDPRTASVSRGESPFQRSSSTRRGTFYPPHMPSGFYSLSRTGGYDSSTDSEEELRLRERHRNRFDEVLRQLNAPMRSITADDRGPLPSVRYNSSLPSARDASVRADTSQAENNSSGAWAGIGGLDWGGGLVAFGAAGGGGGGSANMSTTVNANGGGGGDGGGWLGVGSAASSEEWYRRMRKKLEEEEKAEAASATVIATDVHPTSVTSSTVSVATHIPATVSGNRRPSTQSETHMPAIDRTTAWKGRLPCLLARSRADNSESSPRLGSPSVQPQGMSPKSAQPPKSANSTVLASAGGSFAQRVEPDCVAQMQLSQTCGTLGSTDVAAATTATRPPEASDAKDDTDATSSCSSPPRFCAASVAAPANRAQYTDAPGPVSSPGLEATGSFCRISDMRRKHCSANNTGSAETLSPLVPPAPKRPSESLGTIPNGSFGTVSPSHHQHDLQHHSSLPRVPQAANTAALSQAPPGERAGSSAVASIAARVRNGARLSLVQCSATTRSLSGTCVTPAEDAALAGVGAKACNSVHTEADSNSGVRRNPSAPARQQCSSARGQMSENAHSADKPASSPDAPAAVVASARLSHA
ncbi:hypothetical protein LSCM1_06226 [Leishmania martiniquensis]|uniref:Uncharacterized protein n=1 Tax=Leishmania martiniquensis TaxID=1580590 RepID=A0A836HPV2_9TRYP|nr:hypothetical protein LSCM1_06226 [Leishmania martiniquensis]